MNKQRLNKSVKYIAGVLIGLLFLWLAMRNIQVDKVWSYIQSMTWWWLLPFSITTLFSHYIRAERWKLLVEREHIKSKRSTLFGGVMMGYLMNYVFPRLGEISRCIYVAKKDKLNTGQLIGTVVLERVLDLLLLIIFLFVFIFYIVNDIDTISRLFGEENVESIQALGDWTTLLIGAAIAVAGFAAYKLGVWLLKVWVVKKWILHVWVKKLLRFVFVFVAGLTSIRHMKRWPYFIGLSAGIWVCYAFMAYIPLFAFDMVEQFDLNIMDGGVLMLVSAIGISLPSPGGIGTYHWFTKQALVVLFNVDEVTALSYAFVTHAFMLLAIVVFTPLTVWVNNVLLDRADNN